MANFLNTGFMNVIRRHVERQDDKLLRGRNVYLLLPCGYNPAEPMELTPFVANRVRYILDWMEQYGGIAPIGRGNVRKMSVKTFFQSMDKYMLDMFASRDTLFNSMYFYVDLYVWGYLSSKLFHEIENGFYFANYSASIMYDIKLYLLNNNKIITGNNSEHRAMFRAVEAFSTDDPSFAAAYLPSSYLRAIWARRKVGLFAPHINKEVSFQYREGMDDVYKRFNRSAQASLTNEYMIDTLGPHEQIYRLSKQEFIMFALQTYFDLDLIFSLYTSMPDISMFISKEYGIMGYLVFTVIHLSTILYFNQYVMQVAGLWLTARLYILMTLVSSREASITLQAFIMAISFLRMQIDSKVVYLTSGGFSDPKQGKEILTQALKRTMGGEPTRPVSALAFSFAEEFVREINNASYYNNIAFLWQFLFGGSAVALAGTFIYRRDAVTYVKSFGAKLIQVVSSMAGALIRTHTFRGNGFARLFVMLAIWTAPMYLTVNNDLVDNTQVDLSRIDDPNYLPVLYYLAPDRKRVSKYTLPISYSLNYRKHGKPYLQLSCSTKTPSDDEKRNLYMKRMSDAVSAAESRLMHYESLINGLSLSQREGKEVVEAYFYLNPAETITPSLQSIFDELCARAIERGDVTVADFLERFCTALQRDILNYRFVGDIANLQKNSEKTSGFTEASFVKAIATKNPFKSFLVGAVFTIQLFNIFTAIYYYETPRVKEVDIEVKFNLMNVESDVTFKSGILEGSDRYFETILARTSFQNKTELGRVISNLRSVELYDLSESIIEAFENARIEGRNLQTAKIVRVATVWPKRCLNPTCDITDLIVSIGGQKQSGGDLTRRIFAIYRSVELITDTASLYESFLLQLRATEGLGGYIYISFKNVFVRLSRFTLPSIQDVLNYGYGFLDTKIDRLSKEGVFNMVLNSSTEDLLTAVGYIAFFSFSTYQLASELLFNLVKWALTTSVRWLISLKKKATSTNETRKPFSMRSMVQRGVLLREKTASTSSSFDILIGVIAKYSPKIFFIVGLVDMYVCSVFYMYSLIQIIFQFSYNLSDETYEQYVAFLHRVVFKDSLPSFVNRARLYLLYSKFHLDTDTRKSTFRTLLKPSRYREITLNYKFQEVLKATSRVSDIKKKELIKYINLEITNN